MIDHNIVEKLVNDLTDHPAYESDVQGARDLAEHLVAAGWIRRADRTDEPEHPMPGRMHTVDDLAEIARDAFRSTTGMNSAPRLGYVAFATPDDVNSLLAGRSVRSLIDDDTLVMTDGTIVSINGVAGLEEVGPHLAHGRRDGRGTPITGTTLIRPDGFDRPWRIALLNGDDVVIRMTIAGEFSLSTTQN